MGWKKVREQAFQAGFAETAAEVRQLEQVVQVVDGMSEGSYFAELFFSRFQMLLYFFELGETFLDVLIEFLLDLIGDGEQARVHTVANGIQALRGLLVQVVELGFELSRVSASEVVSSLRTSVSRPDCSCRPAFICSSTAERMAEKPSPRRSATCRPMAPLVCSRRMAVSAVAEANWADRV